MKICFYRHSFLSRGGDKMVAEYANYLQRHKWDVVILTNRSDSVFSVDAKIQPISRNKSKISTSIHALFTAFSHDIIVADIIVLAFFLAWRNKKKLIYFAQDYDESYYKNPFLKLLIRAVYRACLTFLKIPVIAVSDELGRLLKGRFNANVAVIANGVDGAVFYPDKDRELLSLKKESRIVLVFSRRDYRKGFDIALQALSAFRNEIHAGNVAVWSVGEAVDAPFAIRHFGFVRPEMLRKILSCSDALLYPSRHEGLPLFVLEAMACGCPVVTTEAVQFVTHGRDALQCRINDVDCLADQLRRMLQDDQLRRAIEQNAFVTAKRFDIETSLKGFGHILMKHLQKSD